MPEELKSLLTLVFPIVLFLILCVVGALKETIKYNCSFKEEFVDVLGGGFSIFVYLTSLYLLGLLGEHLIADKVMKYGLLIFVGFMWLILILNHTNDMKIDKRISEYKGKNREKIVSAKERLESLDKENKTLQKKLDDLLPSYEELKSELLWMNFKIENPDDYGLIKGSEEHQKIIQLYLEKKATLDYYEDQINKLNIDLTTNDGMQKACTEKLYILYDIEDNF
ncbi:MAG: hypothetical protein IKU41_07705 [Clostridia bacterium]|nr:hypothetical protein [Clostridia bacterium]